MYCKSNDLYKAKKVSVFQYFVFRTILCRCLVHANHVFGFAINIKTRYPITQPLAVLANPPASKHKLEQRYGG